MQRLHKTHNRSSTIGRKLPAPFLSFELSQWTHRQGSASMIAGKPGTLKSILALNMTMAWADAGKSVLYNSADSDEYTVFRRMSGILTGDYQEKVETNDKDPKYRQIVHERFGERVLFEYGISDMEGIWDRMKGFRVIDGSWPDVMFLDNLMDFSPSGGEEWSEMREMTKDLSAMAGETETHIVILHHMRKDAPDGVPPGTSYIQGGLTEKMRLVLSVGVFDDRLMVAGVKNTNGPKPDPSGRTFVTMGIDPSLRIKEMVRY